MSVSMARLQSKIRWRGIVRLHQLSEDSEALLSEAEHQKGSGVMFYACASTGLLFDKTTGACIQSSSVSLLLESIVETKCSLVQFEKWLKERRKAIANKFFSLKRGPKPKGGRTAWEDEEEYYVEVD